jgi:hypothetical protein
MIAGCVQYKDTWASPGSQLYEMVKNGRRNLEEDRDAKPRWTPCTKSETEAHYRNISKKALEIMEHVSLHNRCDDPKCCRPGHHNDHQQ